MLKEYVTHVVRSVYACGPLTRRDLSEIMSITEEEFDELFGAPEVSPKLTIDHIESLTRFFGGDLFKDSFIHQVGSYEDCSGVSKKRARVTDATVTQLSTTANQMLKGSNSSAYGVNTGAASSATAVASVRGYASMIEGAMNLAEIVGFSEEGGQAETEEETEETEETSTQQQEPVTA
jgi:hypothetical protein